MTVTGTPPAKNPPSHFSTRQAKHLEVIARADAKVHRKASRVLEYAAGAAEITDDGLAVEGVPADAQGRPLGWSGVKRNVAKDARLPLKQQPGYLAMMTRVKDSYTRAAADRPVAPTLNVDIQVNVSNPAARETMAAYRVIDVVDENG